MPAPNDLIQFGVHSYRGTAEQLSSQRVLNMYAERHSAPARSPISLHGAPGVVTLATCGSGPVRGGKVMGDLAYVVSGGFLYSITSTGTVTNLGGQISGTGPVSMDDNGDELAIRNGVAGYLYSVDAGFRLVTSANSHAANSVSTMDGFFLHDRVGTNEIFMSDSLDGSTYSDRFASAEAQSDRCRAVRNHLQTLHVLKERTSELWVNASAAHFPFRRIPGPGGVIARGIPAPHCHAVEDSALHILGDDRIAYRLNGNSLEAISTPPINQHWQSAATVENAFCFAYTFAGHKFVVYQLLDMNETWVWDITAKLWHERSSRDMHGNDLGRWRVHCAFPAYDKVLVGDGFSGRVGYLDAATYTEFGCQIIGEVTSPIISGQGKFVTMPWFNVEMETGVGLVSGQGENPQIRLAISDDGGRSYSSPELWAAIGKLGETNKSMVRFGPLGGFYERTLKLIISDPVRRTILATRVPDMEMGI
jgi:hypothetical protein